MRRSKARTKLRRKDMKTLFALAALAAATLSIAPAAAQDPVGAGTIVIRTADLDLTSRAGVVALDRRISAAVRTACGAASDVDLEGKNDVRQCRADTLAGIAAQRDEAIALAQRASQVRLASQ
jgi:UrcA family protein